jgi:hypothetical protein
MPAAWVRLSPAALVALSPVKWRKKSGIMVMTTVAKKHLTAFVRKREAKGAGKPIVKKLFAEAAATTLGMPFREDRNAIIRDYLLKNLPAHRAELGVFKRKSRSRLAGTPGHPEYYEWKYEWTPGIKKKPPTNLVHVVLKGAAPTPAPAAK